MIFYDFHAHVYPAVIAQQAARSISEFYSQPADHTGGAEEKIKVDDDAGISRSVVFPVSVLPKHVKSINDFVERLAIKHEHFIPFAAVHADDPDILRNAEDAIKRGFFGFKMHPDMQGFNIDDERLFPFYDLVSGRLPVVFHSGDQRTTFSHPGRIRRVLELFPRLTVVAAHLGGWSIQETALELLGDKENCFVDTCSSALHMPPNTAVRYIRAYGADRVFFGSDFPLGDPKEEKEMLLSLPLTDGEKEKIASLNAIKFMGG